MPPGNRKIRNISHLTRGCLRVIHIRYAMLNGIIFGPGPHNCNVRTTPANGHGSLGLPDPKSAMNRHARRDADMKSKPRCGGLPGSVPGACLGSAIRNCRHGEGDLYWSEL